jgi:uncharacterized protein YxjI
MTMTSSTTSLEQRFQPNEFTIRQKVFKLLGNAFHVYGPSGEVLLYSKQKAFKLKEDIRLYSGEDMQQEILSIRTTKVIDFSAAYDVVETATGVKLGSFRRKGWSSIVRDSWQILSPSGAQVGEILEDSAGMAIVRRILDEWGSLIFPQCFHATIGGQPVCTYQQNRNPFVRKLTVSFTPGTPFDHRLGIAAGILLAAIEGRQA